MSSACISSESGGLEMVNNNNHITSEDILFLKEPCETFELEANNNSHETAVYTNHAQISILADTEDLNDDDLNNDNTDLLYDEIISDNLSWLII